ncbi:integrase catalytic subunit [Rickettsia canadensis str. CA410]|uniref:Integrase catalytic subunit n=1 Tax=Rickettsia canadensis str. CA410 TaxID=1105107 RepID=A0ABM5MTE5_RICCA|nr:integrase catalytic subunit [Rickettsia canadensis str. CA410]
MAIENIDHTKTKARSTQTNGICETLHRTLKDEFYDIAFCKKIYNSLEDLQIDLDQYLKTNITILDLILESSVTEKILCKLSRIASKLLKISLLILTYLTALLLLNQSVSIRSSIMGC